MRHKKEAFPCTISRINYYPVFLNLSKKNVVVCGGGKVAERKIMSLMKTGANITVISPGISKKLEKEIQKGKLRHIKRQYKKGDLKKAFLVIAATDSRVVNEQIFKDAVCPVNVVDTPDLCNFIVPSVVRRPPLIIAISTSGISPALSKSIRKELEKLYGTEFSSYLMLLQKYRINAINLIKNANKRRRFLKDIGSEKIIRVLRMKGLSEAKRVLREMFKKLISNNKI